MGARTYLEGYFAENMVAVPPHNFCTQISIRKQYGVYYSTNKISKEKLWGGTAGVFSNWLTFGSIPERDVTSGRAPGKDDGRLPKRARAQLGRTWRWGLLCAAGPLPVPRLPIPSPHSTPTRRSSRHSPSNSRKSAKNGSLLLTWSHASNSSVELPVTVP